MIRKMKRAWQRKATMAAMMALAMASTGNVYAMPQDGTVVGGNGHIASQGDTMTITQGSDKLAINWKSFGIKKGETVHFNQHLNSDVALNRVIGNRASEIYGQLSANGHVFLINPNGVLFARGAEVNVGGLVASTRDIDPQAFMKAGQNYTFAGDGNGKVINAGAITAQGGVVALLAQNVENSGTITTQGGSTALAAGNNISIDYEKDGKINLSVNKTAVKASVLNSGTLSADGGYILMTARDASNVLNTVVNNTGTIEAKTMSVNEKGEIVLDGGTQGVVEVGGSIDASGDEAGQTAGNIKAIGAATFVKADANLKATGDQKGGLIETSGTLLDVDENATINASSANGLAGEWLLDPMNVIIDDKGGYECYKRCHYEWWKDV